MSKFKAGDKVVKKYPNGQVGGWEDHKHVTVDYVDDDWVYAKETGGWVHEDRVKFYEPSMRAEREELMAALRLCQSYQIGMYATDGVVYSSGIQGDYLNPQDLVDVLLPLESPAQKKLKELEDQQRELANQMEKLRSEL